MSEDLKLNILKKLDTAGTIADTSAAYKDLTPESILGALKSLEIHEVK